MLGLIFLAFLSGYCQLKGEPIELAGTALMTVVKDDLARCHSGPLAIGVSGKANCPRARHSLVT